MGALMFNFKNQRKMKKVVRMLGLCALVALAFTSCKKKETNGTVTIKATVAQSADDSRTYLDPARNWVMWDSNDGFTVFNQAGENPVYCGLKGGERSISATFQGDADYLANLKTESYTAFYPVPSVDGQNVTLTVPGVQQYVNKGFADNLYPMFAVNSGTDGNQFNFRSDCGLLTIPLGVADGSPTVVNVAKIVVTAADTNDKLVGPITYNYAGPADENPTYTVDGENLNTVTLVGCDLDGSLSNTDLRYFNIVVLENALAGNFSVTLLDGENQEIVTLNAGVHSQIVAQKRLLMDPYIFE